MKNFGRQLIYININLLNYYFRFGDGFGEVDEGPVAEGGMDRVHKQGDVEGPLILTLQQSHTQGHQGTKRPFDGQRRNQIRYGRVFVRSQKMCR